MLIIGGGLDEMVVSATGLTLAPEIDGGEVIQTIEHGTYRTQVHRMVDDTSQVVVILDASAVDSMKSRKGDTR